MALESKFQTNLIDAIEKMLPGCYVLKNDSGYRQGIPDIIILYGDRWAMLEAKRSKAETAPSKLRPNQGRYVEELNDMSYASFVYPENVEEVLYDLQRSLRP